MTTSEAQAEWERLREETNKKIRDVIDQSFAEACREMFEEFGIVTKEAKHDK